MEEVRRQDEPGHPASAVRRIDPTSEDGQRVAVAAVWASASYEDKLRQLSAYVERHPGITARELGQHFGCSGQSAGRLARECPRVSSYTVPGDPTLHYTPGLGGPTPLPAEVAAAVEAYPRSGLVIPTEADPEPTHAPEPAGYPGLADWLRTHPADRTPETLPPEVIHAMLLGWLRRRYSVERLGQLSVSLVHLSEAVEEVADRLSAVTEARARVTEAEDAAELALRHTLDCLGS